jgi:hypothetical protein
MSDNESAESSTSFEAPRGKSGGPRFIVEYSRN